LRRLPPGGRRKTSAPWSGTKATQQPNLSSASHPPNPWVVLVHVVITAEISDSPDVSPWRFPKSTISGLIHPPRTLSRGSSIQTQFPSMIYVSHQICRKKKKKRKMIDALKLTPRHASVSPKKMPQIGPPLIPPSHRRHPAPASPAY